MVQHVSMSQKSSPFPFPTFLQSKPYYQFPMSKLHIYDGTTKLNTVPNIKQLCRHTHVSKITKLPPILARLHPTRNPVLISSSSQANIQILYIISIETSLLPPIRTLSHKRRHPIHESQLIDRKETYLPSPSNTTSHPSILQTSNLIHTQKNSQPMFFRTASCDRMHIVQASLTEKNNYIELHFYSYPSISSSSLTRY